MNRIKIKDKRHHLLWDVETKEILVDVETTNSRTVTECWRDGIEGEGFDTKIEKDNRIKSEKLKYKDDETDVNRR